MASVDGIATGFNTTQMVSSLMSVERVPQNQLRGQKSILSRQQNAYSDLKSLYSKVADRLDTLNNADTWQRRTATSSDTKVAATVTSDATIGQFTFTVNQTATAHAVYTADTLSAADIVSDTGTYAGMTATEAVAAVNNDDTLDTTAALIQTAPGEYRLQLTAKNTGSDSTVGVDASKFDRLTSGFTTLTTGRDAQISVSGDNPLAITSNTNTFDDVMPGLDITVTEPSTEPVIVSVTEDTDSLADDMAALFDDFIGAINRVDGLTKTGESSSSLLSNASVLRRSENNLRNAVFNEVGSSALSTASLAGVELSREGTISFDRQKFVDAYNDDPQAVKDLFYSDDTTQETVFSRLDIELEAATNFTSGYLSTSEDAVEQRVRDIDDQIAAWDIRLDKRESNYRRTFTSLETALSQLQQQSNWLASQIANLPTYGPIGGN
jgi:flagellar hook-associated protein 2